MRKKSSGKVEKTVQSPSLSKLPAPHKASPGQQGQLIAFSRIRDAYYHELYGTLPYYYLEYAVARELINTDIAQRVGNFPSTPSVLIINSGGGKSGVWRKTIEILAKSEGINYESKPLLKLMPYRDRGHDSFSKSEDPRTGKSTLTFSEDGFLAQTSVDRMSGVHFFSTEDWLDSDGLDAVYRAARKFYDFVFVAESSDFYDSGENRSKMPYLPPETPTYQSILASPQQIEKFEESKKNDSSITPVWFTKSADTELTLPGTEKGKPWQTLWGAVHASDETKIRYTATNVATHILTGELPQVNKATEASLNIKKHNEKPIFSRRMYNTRNAGAVGFGLTTVLGGIASVVEVAGTYLLPPLAMEPSVLANDLVFAPYTASAAIVSSLVLLGGGKFFMSKEKRADEFTNETLSVLTQANPLPELLHPAETPVGIAAGVWRDEEQNEIHYIPTDTTIQAASSAPQVASSIRHGESPSAGQSSSPVVVPLTPDTTPQQTASSGTVHLPITQVRKRIEKLKEEWMDYELDPEKLLAAPLIADVSAEPTAKFFVAMKNLESWEQEWDSGNKDIRMLNQTLSEAELAFSQAVYHARKMQLSHLDATQRKKVSDAKPLIHMLKDRNASPHEKIAAYRSAGRMLEGIIPLPEKAIMGLLNA